MKTRFTETIKVQDGVMLNLPYHQARASRTAMAFYGVRIDLSALPAMVPDHACRGVWKCRVVYSDAVESAEFTPYVRRSMENVGVVLCDNMDYGYKYADRERLDRLVAHSGCDDVIIIKNGYVTDSSFANLLFVSDRGLFTPDSFLLPGTKRQSLLDRGVITSRTIRMGDIKCYERICFVNAMLDVEDDVSIETQKLRWLP